MRYDDYQGAEGVGTDAPSYNPLKGQKDSNNRRDILILGVIVLLIAGAACFGFYMVYQLAKSMDLGQPAETHQSVNREVVDDADRHADPDKALALPLRGKFVAVQLGADLNEALSDMTKRDSDQTGHPRYYATILDDEAKVVQEGKLPYNMEGILKPRRKSLDLYKPKDVLKQISGRSAVNPEDLKDFGEASQLNAMTNDADLTYAAVNVWLRKANRVGTLLLVYNHKTGEALYTAEVPISASYIAVHAGKIYVAGYQHPSEDDSQKETTVYGAFAVLDQQTGKQENVLTDEQFDYIDIIEMMGDTPVMLALNRVNRTSALLSYENGKLANFHQFKEYDSNLVWADSEHVLCATSTTTLEVLDTHGEVVKILNSDAGFIELRAQAQDGKLYLFNRGDYQVDYDAIQIITLDQKTFKKEGSTLVRLNEKGGTYLYGMLLPKQ